jgi:hypothetical protein
MYGIALKFVLNQNDSVADSVNRFLLPMFSSFSVVLIFGAIFIQRFLLQEAKRQLVVKFGALELSRLNLADLIRAFYAPCIMRLALLEAVALFGFALAFLNRDLNYFFPFVTVSMAAYFFNFPTEEKIRNAFKS